LLDAPPTFFPNNPFIPPVFVSAFGASFLGKLGILFSGKGVSVFGTSIFGASDYY
jgi:hypothetical protein